jgi:hypothetical protein
VERRDKAYSYFTGTKRVSKVSEEKLHPEAEEQKVIHESCPVSSSMAF